MLGLAFSVEDSEMDKSCSLFRWYYLPTCMPHSGINILRSLGWESATETCYQANVLFLFSFWLWESKSVCLVVLKQAAYKGWANMKSPWISRTKLRGIRITCGGKGRNTGCKSFVPVKTHLAKKYQRQAFSWTESDPMTPYSEGSHPKATICCCPRQGKEASLVRFRFLLKGVCKGHYFWSRYYFWSRIWSNTN